MSSKFWCCLAELYANFFILFHDVSLFCMHEFGSLIGWMLACLQKFWFLNTNLLLWWGFCVFALFISNVSWETVGNMPIMESAWDWLKQILCFRLLSSSPFFSKFRCKSSFFTPFLFSSTMFPVWQLVSFELQHLKKLLFLQNDLNRVSFTCSIRFKAFTIRVSPYVYKTVHIFLNLFWRCIINLFNAFFKFYYIFCQLFVILRVHEHIHFII